MLCECESPPHGISPGGGLFCVLSTWLSALRTPLWLSHSLYIRFLIARYMYGRGIPQNTKSYESIAEKSGKWINMKKIFFSICLLAIASFLSGNFYYKEYYLKIDSISSKYKKLYTNIITEKNTDITNKSNKNPFLNLKIEDEYEHDENYKKEIRDISYLHTLSDTLKYIFLTSLASILLLCLMPIKNYVHIFILNKKTSEYQRIGFVFLCFFAIFEIASIIFYFTLDNYIYVILLWIGIFFLLIGIPLLTQIVEKVIAWIHTGK